MKLPIGVPLLVATSVLLMARPLTAQVVEYTNFAQWQSAAGSYTTITFTEYQHFTIIADQYESLGAIFTDGNDFIYEAGIGLFPQDGFGLAGNFESPISIAFATPQTSIAVHYPAAVQFELTFQGTLISTTQFSTVTGFFAGIVSAQPFDTVVLSNWFGSNTNIDNLYFAPGIPAPGALALLGVAALGARRRRRW
jgi:MYXO-CTERM domain-containing protein